MLPSAKDIIQQGIADGLHTGVQIYISLKGEVIVDTVIGEAAPGRPMKSDDMTLWLSASKPVAAVGAAQLWEQGKLDLDAPVSTTIPEFGVNGKESVTTRHILTHTAGFPNVPLSFSEQDCDTAVAKICAAPLESGWVVGETAAYHPRSSWYILAELIHRIDGRPFTQYIRDEIFLPLNMTDSWIGMPQDVYDGYGDRIVPVYNTAGDTIENLPYHTADEVTSCVPGGNGRGPMRELGRFYEMLLSGGEINGTRILQEATVAEFTRPHRTDTMDQTFRYKMVWGLGFILDSRHHGNVSWPYGYGRHAGPRTFGHGGKQTVGAFADPDCGLVVAVHFNGLPGEPKHYRRIRDFATAVYEDLGLNS